MPDLPNSSDNHATSEESQTLYECVSVAISNYLRALQGQPIANLYWTVLREMELPLLKQVLMYTRDNKSRSAILLGLSRGTLSKKLKEYNLN